MEPKRVTAVLIGMMTNIQKTIFKILQPIVLAIVMLFTTPLVGLLQTAIRGASPVVNVANETVVFKTANTSVAFKS